MRNVKVGRFEDQPEKQRVLPRGSCGFGEFQVSYAHRCRWVGVVEEGVPAVGGEGAGVVAVEFDECLAHGLDGGLCDGEVIGFKFVLA